ncbi:MAG: SDR family oxidoreductase [Niveispirillum sp.]|uniref:SDR family oxidoreductase n=1 Tax=Niveispirillum sp. TaxID=1917217 RepID=UPI003BA7FD1F
MGRVAGKVCLVTGASMGLGRADALALAREGAAVVMADVAADAGEQAAAEIRADTGADVIFVRHDVTSEESWAATMAAVEQRFGRLDVLVNNAGTVVVETVETTTLEQFRKVNAVSAEGTFLGCKHAIGLMKRQGGGSIINMCSVATHLGYPVFFAYSAAKGAVRGMSKSIAIHCQMNGYNIRVNTIHPGAMDTPMVRAANIALFGSEEAAKQHLPPIGSPDDVAAMVLYLASDESRFVNGAELIIDNAVTIS